MTEITTFETNAAASPPRHRHADWFAEARALIALGAPLVLTQLAQMAIVTTDVVMVGSLGQGALAACALGATLFVFSWLVGVGPASAVSPIIAHILGANPRNRAGVRASVRMGLWAAILITPALWGFVAFSKPILFAMNEPAELVNGAAGYVLAIAGGLPFILGFNVLRNFVTALSRPRTVLFTVLAMIAVNFAGNYIFIFGHFGAPALGLVGSGLSSAIANAFAFFVMLAVALRARAFAHYRILRRFHRPDWGKLKEIFRLGVSIGVTQLFEVTLFAASTFLMGQFGTAALAAHQIAINVPSITFMVPLGISMAATVRVGLAAGAGDLHGVRRAGLVAMALGGGFMALCGIGLALFPRTIAGWYLPDTADNAAAIALAATFLRVAAAFQLFDGLQVLGVGLLRGLKDARVPMWLAGGAYWLIGFPLAVFLGFGLGLEGLGVWLGLAAALFAAAAAMVLRFFHKSGILAPYWR
jgi:multidrug resistance protein, MATE family